MTDRYRLPDGTTPGVTEVARRVAAELDEYLGDGPVREHWAWIVEAVWFQTGIQLAEQGQITLPGIATLLVRRGAGAPELTAHPDDTLMRRLRRAND